MIVTRRDIKDLIDELAGDKTLRKPQVVILSLFVDRMRPGEWAARVSRDDLINTTGFSKSTVTYALNGRPDLGWRALVVGGHDSLSILDRRQGHVGKTDAGENEVPLYRLRVKALVDPASSAPLEPRGPRNVDPELEPRGPRPEPRGPRNVDPENVDPRRREEEKGLSKPYPTAPHTVVDHLGNRSEAMMAYDQRTLAAYWDIPWPGELADSRFTQADREPSRQLSISATTPRPAAPAEPSIRVGDLTNHDRIMERIGPGVIY